MEREKIGHELGNSAKTKILQSRPCDSGRQGRRSKGWGCRSKAAHGTAVAVTEGLSGVLCEGIHMVLCEDIYLVTLFDYYFEF